jgi:hypothetical protein
VLGTVLQVIDTAVEEEEYDTPQVAERPTNDDGGTDGVGGTVYT